MISTRRVAHVAIFLRWERGVAMTELVCRRCGAPFARTTSDQEKVDNLVGNGRDLEAALLSCERALALGPERDRATYLTYAGAAVVAVGGAVVGQHWLVPIPAWLGLVLVGLIAIRVVEAGGPLRYFERAQWPRVFERTNCTADDLRDARARLGGLLIARLLSDRVIARLMRSARSDHGSIDPAHRRTSREREGS